jgi:outer membrane phospholipase A
MSRAISRRHRSLWLGGWVCLWLGSALAAAAQPTPASATPTATTGARSEASESGLLTFLKGESPAPESAPYDPDDFFKEHIFGYEPFYFIAGTKSPNAKFQISFKYRLLNERGWLARKASWLTGLHLAYTQTSLWDWNEASAPFFDSSYKPEVLYSWRRLVGGAPRDWFQLDLQGGLQHESNGKAGADSRSLNIAYLRPTFVLGKDAGLQLSLIPRVWAYLGDLSDNPDIADYRGYGDLRAVLGWKRGLQVSALGQMGKNAEHGSVQIDVTYPLMKPPYGSISLHLQVQYFTGYGESLLRYNEKSDALRAGFSIYR